MKSFWSSAATSGASACFVSCPRFARSASESFLSTSFEGGFAE
jgi:hypothetical protein